MAKNKYKWDAKTFYQDWDGDGILNGVDPDPFTPNKKKLKTVTPKEFKHEKKITTRYESQRKINPISKTPAVLRSPLGTSRQPEQKIIKKEQITYF